MSTPPANKFLSVVDPGSVWRIGHSPDPWAWADWSHATAGRFDGRWDAPNGEYRTVYAGDSYLACLVEVLARFRPDPTLVATLNDIVEDEADTALYSTTQAGIIAPSWFQNRRVSQATLTGSYCDLTRTSTIAALRPHFLESAVQEFGLADFDASALLNSGPRALTQAVGRFIYELPAETTDETFDGIRFVSRHGTELTLFAIFERSNDHMRSKHLSETKSCGINPTDKDVRVALEILGLTVG